MAQVNLSNSLLNDLRNYKQKYYTNLLLKGFLISLALLLGVYISINALEYLGRFNSIVRGLFFFGFVVTALAVLLFWVLWPLSKLLHLNKQISDEEAARQIGKYFPEISDKLLNTIQLSKSNAYEGSLLKASITQRTQELAIVKFTDAVNYSENRRYLKYVIIPILFLGVLFLLAPRFFSDMFTNSSQRIINYRQDFVEPAPFSFDLLNKKLQAFKNEDFTISLNMKGRAIPSEVYLVTGERKLKMANVEGGKFEYKFSKIQKPVNFYFDAAGFNSLNYKVEIIERPTLLSFNAFLNYPAYLGKPSERWNNIGNLVVPEGTTIQWQFKTNQSDKLNLIFNEGKDTINAEQKNDKLFQYTRTARSSENYQIRLLNQYSTNKEEINYYINVVPDRYPKITMQEYQDTAVFNFLSIGGSVSDDYGLSTLKLFYQINRKGKPGKLQSLNIPISPAQSIQNYYYELGLEEMNLEPGDKVEYYTQVWDNDGVNGPKSARSTTRLLEVPTKAELKEELDESVAETESQIDRTIDKAKKLQQDIESLENKLLNKKQLDYQDKKLAEEILKKREELSEDIKKLQEKNALINEKQERFFDQSEELSQKMEQLKDLMDELLDEETKKLYEELQKLLEQNRNNDAVLDKLKEINDQEGNLEKELERALEMFKQLKFEQKLEQTVEDLKELAKEQEELSEQTENKSKDNKSLEEKQEEINEQFEKLQEDLNELEQMDQDIQEDNGMQDANEQTEEQKQDISENQQKAIEQLQKNQNKKAGKSQKDAGKQMQEMAQQLSQMQMEMEMEQMQENMDDLRAILENLVTLSFDQEALMKDFRSVNLSDPRFIKLAQQQLKLRDDAKVIEDSLNALAKRVFQIQSFVTRELGQMKGYMDESSDLIKQRKLGNATAKQQFAMTSMNNLALMLNDVLAQMQQAMQNAMSMPQKGKGKPKNSPSLSQLQQQLNQQIQELKKSGKSGRQLSEELAKLAAEQARIRQALRELEKMAGSDKDGKDQLSKQIQELKKQMEENEEDLVNKRLNRISKQRQKDIETRLLQSEKAVRERGEEEERKSEQAKKKQKQVPPSLEQYFRNKEKQIELLKTIPPALSPYYKKEVDEYFEKIDK